MSYGKHSQTLIDLFKEYPILTRDDVVKITDIPRSSVFDTVVKDPDCRSQLGMVELKVKKGRGRNNTFIYVKAKMDPDTNFPLFQRYIDSYWHWHDEFYGTNTEAKRIPPRRGNRTICPANAVSRNGLPRIQRQTEEGHHQ